MKGPCYTCVPPTRQPGCRCDKYKEWLDKRNKFKPTELERQVEADLNAIEITKFRRIKTNSNSRR